MSRKDKDDEDGKGKPETIRFDKPTGLALDASGNLYVADRNNDRIAVLNPTGAVVRSVGRTNPEGRFKAGKGPGEFNKPTGVAVSSSRIAVADRNNERVQVFSADFGFLFEIRLKDVASVPARSDEDDDEDEDDDKGEEPKPFGVALDLENNVYVTDEENGRLLAFNSQGTILFTLGKEGKALGEFQNPKGIAASSLKYLYAADRANKRVQKIDPFRNPVPAFGSAFSLHHPVGMALDGSVNLYVTDRKENRMLKFGLPDGTLIVSLPPRTKEKRGKVDHRGGKVEREDRCGVNVPEGALKQEIEITVEPERPRPSGELARKADKLKEKKLAVASEAVEYGPEGTQFEKAVAISLAYDPDKLPQGIREDDLKVYYWNPKTGDWEKQLSVVNKSSRTVSAVVGHFSLYQVMGPESSRGGSQTSAAVLAADAAFRLGDVFTYPNPARGGAKPVFHVEVGIADKVTIRVYDVAGREVHKATLDQAPVIKDMGGGPRYAYEYTWDGYIASGVYFYVMEAEKGGEPPIRKTGRLAVVR